MTIFDESLFVGKHFCQKNKTTNKQNNETEQNWRKGLLDNTN